MTNKLTTKYFKVVISSCYLFLIFEDNTSCRADDEETVYLGEATIKGLKASDGDYSMYLGIPFAKVDEENHFGPAIPYRITGIYEAYDDLAMCPQVNPENNTVIGTIDCLRLNIYVPSSAHSTNTLFPVMIWIYGGIFQYGFAGRHIFGPRYLVQNDVIIVTVNYRTGPYGFMCLDMAEVSGNQGLKDQYLAIKWVKDNIEAFEGNPDQITLFGQGAGGHSIDLHLMSSRQKLFERIILQSGSAQVPTIWNKPDKLAPLKMARYVGLDTNNTEAAISYLTDTDPKLVITSAVKLNIQFKPCIETLFDNVEPFIESTWVDAEVPSIKNMYVMMGFNKHEKARLVRDVKYINNSSIINDSLKQVLDFENRQYEFNDLISHYYFGDEKINSVVKWKVIRFASDFTYIHPVHRTLKKYLENNAKQVYFYLFSYVGERNAVIATDYDDFDSGGNSCCVSHSDDLNYLFHIQNKPTLNDVDQITMKRMTTMWTNFAKYNNPTPEVSELLPVVWEPVTNSTYNYLNIGVQLILGKRPLHERMAFWDLLYAYYKLSQKEYEEK